MKKFVPFHLLFIFCVAFPAYAAGGEYYLLRLDNGRSVATPHYWFEGTNLYFFYADGTVGIEKGVITKVEKRYVETGSTQDAAEVREQSPQGTKEAPQQAEKSATPKKPPVAKIPEKKVDIAAYKAKKDQLTAGLEDLLEQRRQAGHKDEEGRQELTDKILKVSAEVYGITDEVTAKNKGKLPEGWWNK